MSSTGQIAPINNELYQAGIWKEEFCVTHAGSVLGCIELSGSDPTSLGEHDRKLFSEIQRNLYQSLHPDLIFSQYYFHYEENSITLKEREDTRSDLLSRRRAKFLNNERGLNGSKLYWMLESPSTEDVNTILSTSFLKHLFLAPFEKESRLLLIQKFKEKDAFLAEERQLLKQIDILKGGLKELAERAEIISPNNNISNIQEVWALSKAIANLEPKYLETALNEEVPIDEWDKLLVKGVITAVDVEGMTCLKFNGARPKYARIASVTGYGNKYVYEGLWIKATRSPLLQKGNYIVTNRWLPISKANLGLMLRNKSNELARQQMKLTSLLTGNDVNSELEKKVASNQYLKKKLDELEDAANSEDRYGLYNSHLIVWNEDPLKLKDQCQDLDTAFGECSIHVVWESAGLMPLFPKLLPGYGKKVSRSVEFTTSQAGAASISYKSGEGVKTWGPKHEEATFVLETRDGLPFNFSEFIADKGLVVGTGPTRSGKTFLRLCIAAHFMKFGGLYQDIGVDSGAELLAEFFGDDAGIFRITDPVTSRAFNPYVSSVPGVQDGAFITHMLNILRVMFSLNDAEDLQKLRSDEQRDLDKAIVDVQNIEDPSLRTLTSVYHHLPAQLKMKLKRWVQGGAYGNLFDNVVDGIGDINKRIGVYNLSGLKDNHKLAALAQSEIFYRVTKLFENPDVLDQCKQLQIDECQYFLDVPGAAEFLLAKVRTWNKFNGGISLWTQSPQHYMNIPDWQMIQSSATTFLFGAEQKMTLGLKDLYRKVYGLSEGQVEAIAGLKPRQEMFIWQREADVSQVVQLNAEPELYVIATSRPSEVPTIREAFAKYKDDPDKAISEAIANLDRFKN